MGLQSPYAPLVMPVLEIWSTFVSSQSSLLFGRIPAIAKFCHFTPCLVDPSSHNADIYVSCGI